MGQAQCCGQDDRNAAAQPIEIDQKEAASDAEAASGVEAESEITIPVDNNNPIVLKTELRKMQKEKEERDAADAAAAETERLRKEEQEEEARKSVVAEQDKIHSQACIERQKRKTEWEEALAATREKAHADIVFSGSGHRKNRYGLKSRLPAFNPEKNIPVIALINPGSGAKAGRDVLQVAHRDDVYACRFFDIIKIITGQKRGGLMDVFRIELTKAKDEAKKLNTRPRLISAGGDGTATFAMCCIFRALQANEERVEDGLVDTGNGFIWTDEELANSFPALAQMPLGSANDCGNILGWGQVYPGGQSLACGQSGRAARLSTWIAAVIRPESPLANFDMWGIMPPPGQSQTNFKICELAGSRGRSPKVIKDGKKQLDMNTTGNPVPFFIALYMSVGFFGYVVARFQLNRHDTPLRNTLEYIRQGASVILCERIPPQLKNQLEGITIDAGGEAYFPPRREKGTKASKYREVGFYNINWQAHKFHGYDRAGCCTRMNPCNNRQPVKFQDGLLDMQRQKLLTLARHPGFRMQTDKRSDFHLKFEGGHGKGLFFQYDGEARYAFRPDGGPFDLYIRKVLTVPVVIGPWHSEKLTGKLEHDARFEFSGATEADKDAVKVRICQNVDGKLETEMCATRAELKQANLENRPNPPLPEGGTASQSVAVPDSDIVMSS